MKFTGITKRKFSRDGVALEGEITTVTIAGPAEVLVVSKGAQPDEIKEIANLVNAAPDLLAALEAIADGLDVPITGGTVMAGLLPMTKKNAIDVARAVIAKAKGA